MAPTPVVPISIQDLRLPALVLVVVLLFGSRFSTGSAKQTSSGLAFPFKPFVVFARIAVMVVYIGFAFYYVHATGLAVPVWFYFVFLLVVGLGLLQYPATITLGAEAVTQTFWLLKPKRIGYEEVMTIQRFAAGRALRVLGDNRTVITHTNNHSAPQAFAEELARRTGKPIQS